MGEQVQHSKFGTGTVISVDNKSDIPEVTVAFPGKGIKKLLADYLTSTS
jgi:DNA helicase-2/ATP-dependent DNA helicase PcrA